MTIWLGRGPEFGDGLRIGALALFAGVPLGLAWRAKWGKPFPAVGLLFTAAACVAINAHLLLPNALVTGLLALATAGLVADVCRRVLNTPVPLMVRMLLAAPGAWIVATRTGLLVPDWALVLVGATIAIGGGLAGDFDRRWRFPALGPAMLAGWCVGVYVTVPDTEYALTLLGAAAPLTLLGWPVGLGRLGTGGAFAAAGLVAWVTAFSGAVRLSSVIGGLAALGLLACEPLGRLVGGYRGSMIPRPRWWVAIPMGLAQLMLVFLAARVAGLRSEVTPAAIIAGGSLMAGSIACGVVTRALRDPFAPVGRRPRRAGDHGRSGRGLASGVGGGP